MEDALRAMVAAGRRGDRRARAHRVAAVTYPVTVAEVAARTGAELLVVGSEEVAS